MFQYTHFKEHLFSDYIGNYDTFGIKVFQKTDGEMQCISSISDVSIDSDLTELIAQECTQGQLDPIHLFDVVSDLI